MHIGRFRAVTLAIALMPCFSLPVAAQTRVETNVVYGMYSGSALLLGRVHTNEVLRRLAQSE